MYIFKKIIIVFLASMALMSGNAKASSTRSSHNDSIFSSAGVGWSGIPKFTSGVQSTASAGTDYVIPGGNVATATALASSPSQCSGGQYSTGIAASGNANCTSLPTVPAIGVNPVTCTTSLALNFSSYSEYDVTLTNGDTCVMTISNEVAGQAYAIRIIQGSAGTGLVTWPSGFLWSGGTAPTLTATNASLDMISISYNGTNNAAGALLNLH